MKKLIWFLVPVLLLFLSFTASTGPDPVFSNNKNKLVVYVFPINKEIGPGMLRITQKGFAEARQMNADLVIIRMNTYGGLLDAADSIRTIVLNSPIPVYVFIDNNAASAGALISIAADRIYMRNGANIGAATVVNQAGEALPDKYQSFMRSMMRSTAESHGKDTIINGNDTTYKWKRDPHIAEGMVDPRVVVPGIDDSLKVITFTTSEAIANGYCEGRASTVKEVIKEAGITNYDLKEYKQTGLESMMGFLLNPYFRSILIMLIIAGIYFELQTPGIGFALIVAGIAAVLYFAPAYLEGLAEHWEIALFVVGIALIIVELFAFPGFGVTGIIGITCVVAGLTLSLLNNIVFEFDFRYALTQIFRAFFVVLFSMMFSLLLSIYLSDKLVKANRFNFLALQAEQKSSSGYVGVEDYSSVIGKEGKVVSILRPSGKVEIDGEIYDAMSEIGYINPGEKIKVTRFETGQVYVVKV
ncbi:MAG TPA: NfeD family protein [Bacteroidales bacterium]|nr:NfeD family protein [Bacteroidales bacterium]